MNPMVITKQEFEQLKKYPAGKQFWLPVDFGARTVSVVCGQGQAVIEGVINLDLSEKLSDKFCYTLDEQGLKKIALFSELTNRFYKLIPTPDWPSLAIGSVPMHKLSSPEKDSRGKIALAKPHGLVLDTCMGLGYTAILAAKTSSKVITFEKDECVRALARLNPCSRGLFEAPNIEIRDRDVFSGIREFPQGYFDCVMHDPPTFTLAPELFSSEFYAQARRALKAGGRLFHYTPLYKIKRGYDFPAKVKKKLAQAGFSAISYSEAAGGFLCRK